MMRFQRYGLMAGIILVVFLLLLEWKKFSATEEADAGRPSETLSAQTAGAATSGEDLAPHGAPGNLEDDFPTPQAGNVVVTKSAKTNNGLISVRTDVLDLKIDLTGGDIVMVALPKYWADLQTPDVPFELMNRTTNSLYISQSALVGTNGTDRGADERPVFHSASQEYALGNSSDTLVVDLVLPPQGGASITKRFTFTRGEYLVDVRYLVENNSGHPWQASFFGQIKRDGRTPKTTAAGLQPFLGAAITTTEERYKKIKLSEIEKSPFKESITGGWVAMVQHYFISAWIPNPEDENSYNIRKLKKDEDFYAMSYTGPLVTIPPGQHGVLGGHFYAGPKITRRLEEISPYLDLTVDYGWLWWVAKPIHWVLQQIHQAIQNWGWSIVVLTVLIKLMLFPLSHKAYISMGHMRKVAPRMAAIKEQCGDNRQKLQEEMMKLYRAEKINPLGGCLPMMLQMPVFIALYWVLMESVELRHAPFMGWIEDLSVMDPWFCLPILMGISMYFQQKMNPAPPDPMQAKIMQYLPIIFTVMFLWFPAGLVLYWLVNNLTSMIHQGYINRLTESGKL